MSRIRPIAIAVITRPSDGAILVFDGYDAVKREVFHRPLGGGIEFGETAEAAVRREIREEIGVELVDVALIAFRENLFVLDGKPGHELVAIFAARLADEALCAREELVIDENGQPGKARWVRPASFRSAANPGGPPLYPDGLAGLLGW